MSPSDPKLFDALKEPAIFAETSTLHDLDVPALFESAQERLITRTGSWSDKIMFGTDFSFLTVQAADVITYLMSRDFSGTLVDAQKILGGNALHLIQKPFRTAARSSIAPKEIYCHDKTREVQYEFEHHWLARVAEADWDLASLDFMVPPARTWPQSEPARLGAFNGVYLDSYLLAIRRGASQDVVHLWIRRRAGGLLSVSLLGAQGSVGIESLEHAAQRGNAVLSQALAGSSVLVKNAREMTAEVNSSLG